MDLKTARLITWQQPLPQLGEYLKTKAGSYYLVISVRPNTRPNPKTVAKVEMLKLTTDEITEVPHDAVIYDFYWTR